MNRRSSNPTTVTLTERGWKTVTASLFLFLVGVGLRDIIIGFTSLLLGFTTLIQFLLLRSMLSQFEKTLRFTPNSVESSLTAGDEFIETLSLNLNLELNITFSSHIESLLLTSPRRGVGGAFVDLIYRPMLSGEYTSNAIQVEAFDRFGLARGVGDLDFHIHFSVYPRVFPVALEALEFLYDVGAMGSGSSPLQLRGRGLEYAESRDYVPGDPMNIFDWKATARLGKPIVKEHYIEGGEIPFVVYENSAPDPVSLDEVATSFLEVVLSLARTLMPLNLMVVNGREVLLEDIGLPYHTALEVALKFVLSGVEEGFIEYYSILEPEHTTYLSHFFDNYKRMSFVQSGLRGAALSLRFSSDDHELLLISSLSGDPLPLLELLRENRSSVYLIQPTRPWLWANNLEESVRLWNHHEKMDRIFSRIGVIFLESIKELNVKASALAISH